MGKNAVIVLSVLMVAVMTAGSVPLALAGERENSAPQGSGSWKQTTDGDFGAGTRPGNDLGITGKSAAGSLVLTRDGDWKEIKSAANGTRPAGRVFHAMSFDEKAKAMVLFGGSGMLDSYSNETWTYDLSGNQWRQQYPKESPRGRFGQAMVYVPAIGASVMFGGFTIETSRPLNDTWYYDISRGVWENKTSVHSPPARGYHAMAYDSVRGLVVVFGGGPSFSKDFNDTWELNPLNGTWKGPVNGPSALKGRTGHGMVYDTEAHQMLMFGGRNSSTGRLNDTWHYTGSWAQVVPQASPNARSEHAMVFDSFNSKAIIFGGLASVSLNDVWYYDGSKNIWNRIPNQSLPVPPALTNAVMVFDKAHSLSIMFGGMSPAAGERNEVWTLNGATWRWNNNTVAPLGGEGGMVAYRSAADSLISFSNGMTYSLDLKSSIWSAVSSGAPITDGAMVYYPLLDRLIMFGGFDGALDGNDTKRLDFASGNWENLGLARAPERRSGHAMVYVESQNRIMLYGGYSGIQKFTNVWMYDPAGSVWNTLTSISSPGGRKQHAMAYDPPSGKVVLFGGRGDSGVQGDTWIYDPSTSQWTNPAASPSPSPREGSSMVYDAKGGKLLMFGGKDAGGNYLGDLWEYNVTANTWTQITTAHAPPARWKAGCAYCNRGEAVVMAYGAGASQFSDLWVYPAYRDAGIFISSKWDTGMSLLGAGLKDALDYEKIWWNGTGPLGSLLFQLRSASTEAGLDSAQWYGPTGPSDFYDVPGTDVNPVHMGAGARWIQYQMYVNTSNPGETPVLEDITITYSGNYVVADFGTPLVPVFAVLFASAAAIVISRRKAE